MTGLENIQYRVHTLYGEATAWKPLHGAAEAHLFFPGPSDPEEYRVMAMDLRIAPEFPGPGWYGPVTDEVNRPVHPTELRWVESYEDWPDGWFRWSERRDAGGGWVS